MDWWLLTFFLGAILSLFLPEVPAISQLILLLCLTIGFFLHKNSRLSSGLLLGSLWLLIQAYLYQSQLPNTLVDLMHNKQVFVVEGDVLSIVYSFRVQILQTPYYALRVHFASSFGVHYSTPATFQPQHLKKTLISPSHLSGLESKRCAAPNTLRSKTRKQKMLLYPGHFSATKSTAKNSCSTPPTVRSRTRTTKKMLFSPSQLES